MKNKQFLLLSNSPWELEIGSNIRNIAHELSKHNEVLFVNQPIDRTRTLINSNDPIASKYRAVLKDRSQQIQKVQNNLWTAYPNCIAESINWMPIPGLFKYLNKRNNQRFAKAIRSILEKVGFKDYIILNDSLMFKGLHLKELLSPSMYVYYVRDYLISQPYFMKHGQYVEKQLIQRADLVVANSVFLTEYAKKYNLASYFIGQGYEIQNFDYQKDYSKPAELIQIKGPVIGYIGALNHHRLDFSILEAIPTELTDFSLVLVGPEDDAFKESKLHQFDNVHFLGLKTMDELAGYLRYFDVCINPQLVNDLTIGNYPIKIDEYLAMGKPTVATDTKAMKLFKDHCYLAKSPKEFVAQIQVAYSENNQIREASRVEFAQTHTWEKCVNHIYELLQKNSSQKP